MNDYFNFRFMGVASAMLFCCSAVQADGISDLKAALNRLQGQANVKAVLEVKNTHIQGAGSDAVETNGQIQVNIEDGTRGMLVHYSKDTLSKLDQEAKARSKNKESKTPTRNATAELSSDETQMMLSAVNSLQRQIEEASFKGEKVDQYNGKAARLLSFAFGMERLSNKDKKYIKSFESQLDVWIGPDGAPMASRLLERGSGRAFIVVSFQLNAEQHNVYQVLGDRLLIVRRESKSQSSGAGERADTKVIKTLQLLS